MRSTFKAMQKRRKPQAEPMSDEEYEDLKDSIRALGMADVRV